MSNYHNIFPNVIASALQRAFGSYLVPNGAAVRHANGYQEILVSYPNLDTEFPEHYPLFTEGFREKLVHPVAAGAAETVQEAPQATIEAPAVQTEAPAEQKATKGRKPRAKADAEQTEQATKEEVKEEAPSE